MELYKGLKFMDKYFNYEITVNDIKESENILEVTCENTKIKFDDIWDLDYTISELKNKQYYLNKEQKINHLNHIANDDTEKTKDRKKELLWLKENENWLFLSRYIAIFIIRKMKSMKITKKDLIEKSKMDYIILNNMLKGTYNFSISEIEKLNSIFNVNFYLMAIQKKKLKKIN